MTSTNETNETTPTPEKIEYTWEVLDAEKYRKVAGVSDVIHSITFQVTGTSSLDGVTGHVSTKVELDYRSIIDEDYISHDEITEADMLRWLRKGLGNTNIRTEKEGGSVMSVEEKFYSDIEEQIKTKRRSAVRKVAIADGSVPPPQTVLISEPAQQGWLIEKREIKATQ